MPAPTIQMIAAAQNFWSGIPVSEHLFVFSPMIALVVTMLAIVICPLVANRSPRLIAAVTSIGIVAALVLAIRVARSLDGGGISGLSTQPSAGLLVADNLSSAYQIVLLVFLAAVTYLWWIGQADRETDAPEFFILLLGSALGMSLMVSTTNLLMIVIAIETASLPSYAIVGFDKKDRLGAEASLKYVIFGAVCAAVMLYGVSLLYGLIGSLNVSDVAQYTFDNLRLGQNRILLSVGLFCLFAGIAFKISAFPFHFWCPDAFQGARIEVTTWLSVVSKAAGLILLARTVAIFCAAVDQPASLHLLYPVAWTLGIIAAITCTVGNFAAYQQTSIKRLLAYSSIAHAGYMMMATAVWLHPSSAGFQQGLSALLIYIVIYMFMNLGAFGVAAMVYWDTGSDSIDNFAGLIRRSPALAIPMVICLVSLVGLPPFAGFLGKWWILVALGTMGTTLGWFLIIVAVLNTLFSLYFYVRVIVQMALRDEGGAPVQAPVGGLALVNVCAIMLLALFIFAAPLKNQADRFSQNLFNPIKATGPAVVDVLELSHSGGDASPHQYITTSTP